jgi:uncharacterized protein (TIGR00369 family)
MANPDKVLLKSHRPGDALSFEAKDQAFASALGARLIAVDAQQGIVELQFSPTGQFLQGAGVVQGGAVSAMLDFAMGFAGMAMTADGFSITTATLNVAFLRAAPAGDYVAKGIVERRGRTMIFVRGELRSTMGTLVATGTSSLVVIQEES